MSPDIDTLMRAEIRGLRKRLEECEDALVNAALSGYIDPGCDYINKYNVQNGTSKPVTSMLNELTLGGEAAPVVEPPKVVDLAAALEKSLADARRALGVGE